MYSVLLPTTAYLLLLSIWISLLVLILKPVPRIISTVPFWLIIKKSTIFLQFFETWYIQGASEKTDPPKSHCKLYLEWLFRIHW